MLSLRCCYYRFALRIFIIVTFVISAVGHIQVPIILFTFMVFGTSGLIFLLQFITDLHSLIFCSPILEPHLDLKKNRNDISEKDIFVKKLWKMHSHCCTITSTFSAHIIRAVALMLKNKCCKFEE